MSPNSTIRCFLSPNLREDQPLVSSDFHGDSIVSTHRHDSSSESCPIDHPLRRSPHVLTLIIQSLSPRARYLLTDLKSRSVHPASCTFLLLLAPSYDEPRHNGEVRRRMCTLTLNPYKGSSTHSTSLCTGQAAPYTERQLLPRLQGVSAAEADPLQLMEQRAHEAQGGQQPL